MNARGDCDGEGRDCGGDREGRDCGGDREGRDCDGDREGRDCGGDREGLHTRQLGSLTLASSAVLECEREGRRDLEAIVQACLLPCSAGRRAWAEFDARIERADELLASSGRIDVEIARLAVRTAQICREAGETKRALRCDDIAIAQWTALGRPEEVEAVRASARRQ